MVDALFVDAGWTFRRNLKMMVIPLTHVAPLSPDQLNVGIERIEQATVGDVIALSDLAFGSRSNPSLLVDHPHTHGYPARERSGAVVAMGA